MAKAIVSKSDLAGILQVSKARISQMVKAGMPVRTDGRIDRAAAVKWHRDSRANFGLKPGPVPNAEKDRQAVDQAETSNLITARARKESATAELRELEAAQRRGDLLIRSEAERAWGGMVLAARSALLLMPDKLCHLLVGRTVEEIREKLRDEINTTLKGLAAYQPSNPDSKQ